MELKIDQTSVQTALKDLKRLENEAREVAQSTAFRQVSAAYSAVSGLDQLGQNHGQVITGGLGSAQTVLTSYAEQIDWLRGALNASVEALSGQDELFARGMDIADIGGKVAEESVMFPQRPAPRFDSFVFSPPMVRPALSLDELCAQFSGTNSGAVLEAQGSWNSMASAISNVSASLSKISAQLLAENSGETFEQASQRINDVSLAGTTFAANARVMAASVGTLNRIYTGHRMQVFLAAASISAILDPIKRAAAERAFLASFQATFQADVLTGIPPVNNLMQMKNADGSSGGIALGMADIAGGKTVWSAAGLTPAGLNAVAGAAQAVSQVGAGSFGTFSEGMDSLEIGDLATSAASTGVSSSSVSSLPMSQSVAGGLGGGAGANGGFGSSIPSAAMIGGNGKHALNALTNSGRMSPAGSGIKADSMMGARTHGASAMGGGMAPMMGSSGVGAGGGGLSNNAKMQAKQATPAAGSAAPSTHGLGTSGKASQSMGRGMMPMMPMGGAGAGAGGQKNTGKVKSVTSAVEEDRNIAALLGDRGPVVPGVIGDWVRG